MTDEKCPQCKKLAESLEWLKERNEANLNANLDLCKHLCDLARLLGREGEIEADTTTTDVVDWGIAEIECLRARIAYQDDLLTQTPPATNDEPATGMALFDEDGNPVTDGEAGFRPLTGVCRVCGYGCCVHFSGEIKASTIECPVCHKDGPETQTPP